MNDLLTFGFDFTALGAWSLELGASEVVSLPIKRWIRWSMAQHGTAQRRCMQASDLVFE